MKKRKQIIELLPRTGPFAEDKDIAAELREKVVRPAIIRKTPIVLDFSGVEGATQSFIHALIADVVRDIGPGALDTLEFKSCNSSVKGVISIVVEYCQLDVSEDEAEARSASM